MDADLLRAAEAATGFMPGGGGTGPVRRGRALRGAGGPVLEVGIDCGKSTIYLAAAARAAASR